MRFSFFKKTSERIWPHRIGRFEDDSSYSAQLAAFANSTHVQKNKNIEPGKKLIEHYLVLPPFTGNVLDLKKHLKNSNSVLKTDLTFPYSKNCSSDLKMFANSWP